MQDKKAEEIWNAEGFALKGKSKSKWLAYYMGMRSAVFDMWVKEQIQENPQAIVIHIGCGMDSRILRVIDGECVPFSHEMNSAEINRYTKWYDVDFPEVIAERQKYYAQSENYHMIGADAREEAWLEQLPQGQPAIVIMEGISMYFDREALRHLLENISKYFTSVNLLMDCYTEFAAKASKYKNPINDVGVTQVYGLDNPEFVQINDGLQFVKEHDMTPQVLIEELKGLEQKIFKKVFAGSFSKKMYRLYEYKK